MSIEDKTGQPPEDEELIPVETPPGEAPQEAATEGDEHDEDDDHEDARLAEHEDDEHDDDAQTANNRRRRQRREAQRRAREASERRIEQLAEQNRQLAERLAQVEGHSIQTTVQSLDAAIQKALSDAQQAEAIEAKATTAGNGEDAVLARRIREAAIDEARQLQQRRQAIVTSQQAAQPQQQGGDLPLRETWLQANPWFGAQGAERHTALVKGIDSEIAREGFDPKSPEYWTELTRRASEAINRLDGKAERTGNAQSKPPRGGPPTGGASEHAGPATRSNEIYVTPERKQAMIDLGVWDDPAARQRYLKAYREYDKTNAAR